jgi:hypothetical protein
MLSFHNDPAIKQKYLARVIAHRKADNLIQGIGWKNGKGCAIGCILEDYDHSRYPQELGLPIWLAMLQDIIFENLPNKESQYWPENSLAAIPIGINVEIVRHQIAIKKLDRLIKLQNHNLENNKELKDIILPVISSIEIIKKCHEAEINKNYCDWSAARSAAMSAESAARSAAWLAESVESVESVAWKQEADDLIELLQNCH